MANGCNIRRLNVSCSRGIEAYLLTYSPDKWVQYSTFECVLSSAKFEELQKRLRYRVKLEEDSIRFYPLSRHTSGQVETWGVGPPITEFPGSVII